METDMKIVIHNSHKFTKKEEKEAKNYNNNSINT